MTTPYERTRALIETKSFLQELQDPKLAPRVPAAVREIARKLLRHYPSYYDVELAHKSLPCRYGPVPPFSRLAGGEQQMKCEVCVYVQSEAADGRLVVGTTCVRCGREVRE